MEVDQRSVRHSEQTGFFFVYLDVECETKRTTEKVDLPLTEVGKTQSANVAA